jgi:hypothetical protein
VETLHPLDPTPISPERHIMKQRCIYTYIGIDLERSASALSPRRYHTPGNEVHKRIAIKCPCREPCNDESSEVPMPWRIVQYV